MASLQFEPTCGLRTAQWCTYYLSRIFVLSQLPAPLTSTCNMLIGLLLQAECDFCCIISIYQNLGAAALLSPERFL